MGIILDRMGWYDIKYETRHWSVWFIVMVVVGTALKYIPWDLELQWPHLIVLAMVTYFIARLIVGKPRKKDI